MSDNNGSEPNSGQEGNGNGHTVIANSISSLIALMRSVDDLFGILGQLCGDQQPAAATRLKAWPFCAFAFYIPLGIYYLVNFWTLKTDTLAGVLNQINLITIIIILIISFGSFFLTIALSDKNESICTNFLQIGMKCGTYAVLFVVCLDLFILN